MRLYAKLLLMILLAGALQHAAQPRVWGAEAWFAARCHLANLLGDDKLSAELVEEHYRKTRTIGGVDIAREEVEIELRLAAG